jgi:SAM-dependent methyltransferase
MPARSEARTGMSEPADLSDPLPWPESVRVAEACAQLLIGHRIGRLLDAGGGNGSLTTYLMRHRVVDAATVLDLSDGALAKVPPPIMTKRGRVEDLDTSDGEFATILMRQVLHYIGSPVAALECLRGRLLPGGVIYVGQIVAPDADAARWLGDAARWVSPSRHRVWTVDQLLVTFANARLRLDKATVLSHWQALDLRNGARITDHARRCMPVRRSNGAICCRVFWLHALLTPEL